MASQWFYQVMGKEVGPISSAELRNLAQRGAIERDTPVREAPDCAWVPAETVQGLFPVANPTAPPMPLSATGDTRTPGSSSASERVVAQRICVFGGVISAILLLIAVIFVVTKDFRDIGGKHKSRSAGQIEAKFDPQDIRKTANWLVEITKSYMQAQRSSNVYSIAEAEDRIRQQIKEIPFGTPITWTTTVAAVEVKGVLVYYDDTGFYCFDHGTQFNLAISADERPPDHPDAVIPIGKGIDFGAARSLKATDPLVLAGNLRELTVAFHNGNETVCGERFNTAPFASYKAVIVNARAIPRKRTERNIQ